ncbi:MAG: FtsX-like permease family protein, partial [Eubacteriales bacterium]|nr:FtsX-like permease family protein [Eubacteriales bacterium]
MKLRKRAFLAIIRRKKISAALLLLFFLLSLTLLLGLSIFRSVQQAIVDVRQTFATSFSVELSEAVQGHVENRDPSDPYYTWSPQVYRGERVTPDVVENIASTEGVKDYDAVNIAYQVRSDDITLFPGLYSSTDWWEDLDVEKQKSTLVLLHTLEYESHCYSELASEFRTNAFELVEGRHLTPEDFHSVVISDELAEKNGLEIGNTFHVYYDGDINKGYFDGYDGVELDGYECDLTVVGIFHINATQIITNYTVEQDIAANQAFLDINTAYEYHEYGRKNGVTDPFYFENATFFVEDPAELDTVMERVLERDDVDWDCLDIDYDETTYESAIKPLQKMQKIVGGSIAAIICVMVALLYLVLQMSIQGREKELKVYHALGIRKRTVFGQFVLECILLALLAFLPASVITATCANSLGNATLSLSQGAQKTAVELSDAEIREALQNGTFSELTDIQMDASPQEIAVSLSPAVIALVLLLLLLAIVIFVLWQLRDDIEATLPTRKRITASHASLVWAKPSQLIDRAMLYILRERKKSLHLGAILLVFAVFLTVCSSVYGGTERSLEEVRKTIDVSFRLNSTADDNLVVDDTWIEKVMSLGGCKAYDGENVMTLYAEEFQLVPGYFTGNSNYDEYLQHVMRITAHHNSELAQDFVYGNLELAEG